MQDTRTMTFGPFRLDLGAERLWRGAEALRLTNKAFAVLRYLVEHPEQLVTKDALLEVAWPQTFVSDAALTVCIRELRRTLGDSAQTPQFIETVRGRGFRFLAPVAGAAPAPWRPEGATVPAGASATVGDQPLVRRLAAIFTADVQGYSRLMGEDEAATVHTLTAYRAVLTSGIAQHRGRVVDTPGDNLLAEFASVVDAVQCAVAIQSELADRNAALPASRQMWFRIGINLGDVLVDGERIYGDGVNIAARVESLAEGGGICVSGTVYDQIATKLAFTYTALGEHALKNIATPVRVYRLEFAAGASTSRAFTPAAPSRAPTSPPPSRRPVALVGREAELLQLQRGFARALQGDRQVLFIKGEAGIGKTTLVDAFVAHMTPHETVWLSYGQCIEQYGAGEAYLPLLEALGQLCRGPDGGRLVPLLAQQAPSWLVQMPALLSAAEYAALQRRGVGATRERMLRELAEAMETLTAERPLVLVLEDLHWCDYATLEWLALVARRREAARLLVLGTYRPVEPLLSDHPVPRLAQELQRQGCGTELVLDYLSVVAVATYLAGRFGDGALPDDLARIIRQRTNGNPLFMINVVDALVQQGILQEGDAGWHLVGGFETMTATIPESLRQLIEQQLRQVAPATQVILEAASVAGMAFSAAAVAACISADAVAVEAQCTVLARQGQFLQAQGTEEWPDGTVAARFGFIHALYQEVLYNRVPAGQRAQWHRQIGLRLEAGYGVQARGVAAELAVHFVQGRDTQRAVRYLQYAGELAVQRSAHREAITHLTTALDALAALPDTQERTQRELTLHVTLGPPLIATKGYAAPEVEHVYTRARALCREVGDTLHLCPILYGLWTYYTTRADYETGRTLCRDLLNAAESVQDAASLLDAHVALTCTSFFVGEFDLARQHGQRGMRLYDPLRHRAHALQNPGVVCGTIHAVALWYLGYPDQARRKSDETLRLTRELSHPFSSAVALTWLAMLHQCRRDAQEAQALAEEAMAISSEQGFPFWGAVAAMVRGWALVEHGWQEEGGKQVRECAALAEATGARIWGPYRLALLAAADHRAGQTDAAQHRLAEALTVAEKCGERYWEAELYRCKGELLLSGSTNERAEAETCLKQAIEVARRQQATSLELRAATSLARLWQSQGKRQDAYALLAPVYNWFTEGFDTPDLQVAKALLEEGSS